MATDPVANTPHLVTVPGAATAVVSDVVPLADLRGFFDSAFGTLPRVLAGQGITVLGAAFACYRDHVPNPAVRGDNANGSVVLDLEVGFPVDRAVLPQDGVTASSLPAGPAVRLVHTGGFDGLADAWQQLDDWIDRRGFVPRPLRWEVYLVQPTPDMDPADLRTELLRPVTEVS